MSLPKWAEQIEPVDMNGAARLLGVSRRTLTDILRRHPVYERRGKKKVFYPEQIRELRERLCSDSKQTKRPASGRFTAPSRGSVLGEALALATSKPRRRS